LNFKILDLNPIKIKLEQKIKILVILAKLKAF